MAIFNALLNLRELKELYSGKPVCVCPLYNGVINEPKTFKATGNPIVLPEYKSLVKLKTTFSPKQAGTGDPSPDNVRPITGRDSVQVTRCGKNLFGGEENLWIAQTEEVTREGAYSSLLIPCKEGDIFTLSTSTQFALPPNNAGCMCFYSLENEYVSRKAYTYGKIHSLLSPPGASYVRASCYHPDKDKIQFELGSTPTYYEPYQGDTHDIALPETVYGGTVDCVTGEGEKTWSYIASYNGEDLPGEWISDRDVYAPGTTPTTGAQVAYKLATPESFKVSQVSISSLRGENYFFTNGENMDIIYKEEYFWSDEA